MHCFVARALHVGQLYIVPCGILSTKPKFSRNSNLKKNIPLWNTLYHTKQMPLCPGVHVFYRLRSLHLYNYKKNTEKTAKLSNALKACSAWCVLTNNKSLFELNIFFQITDSISNIEYLIHFAQINRFILTNLTAFAVEISLIFQDLF